MKETLTGLYAQFPWLFSRNIKREQESRTFTVSSTVIELVKVDGKWELPQSKNKEE